MSIQKTYTFTNNTIIDPDEVNQNFDDCIDAIKTSHHRDADGIKISREDIDSSYKLVPSGGIIAWSGAIANIPTGWYLCDGSNGTPDLRNRFILGAGGSYSVGATGGSSTINISHSHTYSFTSSWNGDHNHTYSGTTRKNHGL